MYEVVQHWRIEKIFGTISQRSGHTYIRSSHSNNSCRERIEYGTMWVSVPAPAFLTHWYGPRDDGFSRGLRSQSDFTVRRTHACRCDVKNTCMQLLASHITCALFCDEYPDTNFVSCRDIVTVRRTLADRRRCQWILASQLHLTLCYLARTSADVLDGELSPQYSWSWVIAPYC